MKKTRGEEHIDVEEENEETPCAGLKAAASTIAGASLGVLGGVAGITAAALGEVLLPVALCLWAGGLAGGALGLMAGMDPQRSKGRR